jgi:hypothetical protein
VREGMTRAKSGEKEENFEEFIKSRGYLPVW